MYATSPIIACTSGGSLVPEHARYTLIEPEEFLTSVNTEPRGGLRDWWLCHQRGPSLSVPRLFVGPRICFLNFLRQFQPSLSYGDQQHLVSWTRNLVSNT